LHSTPEVSEEKELDQEELARKEPWLEKPNGRLLRTNFGDSQSVTISVFSIAFQNQVKNLPDSFPGNVVC
jgi:hypothetical protein